MKQKNTIRTKQAYDGETSPIDPRDLRGYSMLRAPSRTRTTIYFWLMFTALSN